MSFSQYCSDDLLLESHTNHKNNFYNDKLLTSYNPTILEILISLEIAHTGNVVQSKTWLWRTSFWSPHKTSLWSPLWMPRTCRQTMHRVVNEWQTLLSSHHRLFWVVCAHWCRMKLFTFLNISPSSHWFKGLAPGGRTVNVFSHSKVLIETPSRGEKKLNLRWPFRWSFCQIYIYISNLWWLAMIAFTAIRTEMFI